MYCVGEFDSSGDFAAYSRNLFAGDTFYCSFVCSSGIIDSLSQSTGPMLRVRQVFSLGGDATRFSLHYG
jgi:hypothetical protein